MDIIARACSCWSKEQVCRRITRSKSSATVLIDRARLDSFRKKNSRLRCSFGILFTGAREENKLQVPEFSSGFKFKFNLEQETERNGRPAQSISRVFIRHWPDVIRHPWHGWHASDWLIVTAWREDRLRSVPGGFEHRRGEVDRRPSLLADHHRLWTDLRRRNSWELVGHLLADRWPQIVAQCHCGAVGQSCFGGSTLSPHLCPLRDGDQADRSSLGRQQGVVQTVWVCWDAVSVWSSPQSHGHQRGKVGMKELFWCCFDQCF